MTSTAWSLSQRIWDVKGPVLLIVWQVQADSVVFLDTMVFWQDILSFAGQSLSYMFERCLFLLASPCSSHLYPSRPTQNGHRFMASSSKLPNSENSRLLMMVVENLRWVPDFWGMIHQRQLILDLVGWLVFSRTFFPTPLGQDFPSWPIFLEGVQNTNQYIIS